MNETVLRRVLVAAQDVLQNEKDNSEMCVPVGACGTLPLTEHTQKERMFNTRCVFAVALHFSKLLNRPVQLSRKSAASDQTFDTILIVAPVVWPRNRGTGRHPERRIAGQGQDSTLIQWLEK